MLEKTKARTACLRLCPRLAAKRSSKPDQREQENYRLPDAKCQVKPCRHTSANGFHILVGKDPDRVFSFTILLCFNAFQTFVKNGVKHVALGPRRSLGKSSWKNGLIDLVMPPLNRIGLRRTKRNHGHQTYTSVPCDDHDWPLLHHFWRFESGCEIANQNLTDPWVKRDRHMRTLYFRMLPC